MQCHKLKNWIFYKSHLCEVKIENMYFHYFWIFIIDFWNIGKFVRSGFKVLGILFQISLIKLVMLTSFVMGGSVGAKLGKVDKAVASVIESVNIHSSGSSLRGPGVVKSSVLVVGIWQSGISTNNCVFDATIP